jgi:histidine triad (HIT) family protein
MLNHQENCIFCKILSGSMNSIKLYEDEKCLVILDKFPATKGQALVIAKTHIDYIAHLDEKYYNHLFFVAKKIISAMDSSLNTLRTCIVVEGFEVPHAHIRLHPAYEKRLLLKGEIADDDDLRKIAEKIKKFL